MSLQTLMHPEVWREKITEIFLAKTKFLDTLPVERRLTKKVHYFVQKTVAMTPEIFVHGAGLPYSMGTYEKEDATPELYGYGIEILKIDVDLLPFGWNTVRREIEQKATGMALYLDKRISDAMVAGAGITRSCSSSKWTTPANIMAPVIDMIKQLEAANNDLDSLVFVVSPYNHAYILASLVQTALTMSPPGKVENGRVTEYLGLPVQVSNNMTTPQTAIIYSKNNYGWLNECYPLTTMGPKYDEDLMAYRAQMYAMNVPVVDQPMAVATMTSTY